MNKAKDRRLIGSSSWLLSSARWSEVKWLKELFYAHFLSPGTSPVWVRLITLNPRSTFYSPRDFKLSGVETHTPVPVVISVILFENAPARLQWLPDISNTLPGHGHTPSQGKCYPCLENMCYLYPSSVQSNQCPKDGMIFRISLCLFVEIINHPYRVIRSLTWVMKNNIVHISLYDISCVDI